VQIGGVPINLQAFSVEPLHLLLEKRARNRTTLVIGIILGFSQLSAQVAKQSVTYFGNPLTCAAGTGNIELVRILLTANINARPYWRNALKKATRRGHLEVVRLLIDFRRPELNYSHYDCAIRQAALGGQVEVLRWLLAESNLFSNEANNHSSDILGRAWEGPESFWLETILLKASLRGQESVMRMALESGAYPTVRFQFLKTGPLEYACSGGYENIVRLLLSQPMLRENIAFKSHLNAALCRAARGGWLSISELLIKCGAQINPETPIRNRIPWVGTAERGHVDLLQFLIEHGANLKVNEELFERTVQHAKARGYNTIVQILRANGVESSTNVRSSSC
jgi:ankyrin repeat protein